MEYMTWKENDEKQTLDHFQRDNVDSQFIERLPESYSKDNLMAME